MALQGESWVDNYYRTEFNGDLLIKAKKDNVFTQGFNATILLGHDLNSRITQNSRVVAQDLGIPFFTIRLGLPYFLTVSKPAPNES